MVNGMGSRTTQTWVWILASHRWPSAGYLTFLSCLIYKNEAVWTTTQQLEELNLIHTRTWMGLPWWRSGWESACKCRGHGFEPWSGKIPHAAEHLGPWATTTEPVCLEPVLRNKRGHNSERPAHCDEEWPPLAATRESPRAETKTQHSQK